MSEMNAQQHEACRQETEDTRLVYFPCGVVRVRHADVAK